SAGPGSARDPWGAGARPDSGASPTLPRLEGSFGRGTGGSAFGLTRAGRPCHDLRPCDLSRGAGYATSWATASSWRGGPPPAVGSVASTAAPQRTREVTVYDTYFSPSFLVVPPGTLVRWKNWGHHRHTVTFPKASPGVDSGPLPHGGEFRVYCGSRGTF